MQYTTGVFHEMLSPEMKLMLLCSNLDISAVMQEDFDKLLSGSLNWELFSFLTLHHGLYPVVYHFLNNQKFFSVPDSVLKRLRDVTKTHNLKILQMTHELVSLSKIMENSGIRPIILKGIPLGYQLYGRSTFRTITDLDILVAPEEVPFARDIIEHMGYEPTHPVPKKASPKLFKRWMLENQHMIFLHPKRDICIELHWRMGYYGWEEMLLFDNSVADFEIAGHKLRVLNNETLLLYLILHGAFHSWFRLRWLLDVYIFLKKGGFDWERLYSLADLFGSRQVVNQAVILSSEFWDSSAFSARVEHSIQDNKAVKLANMAMPLIMNHDYWPQNQTSTMTLFLRQKKYCFFLFSRWRERIQFILRQFFPTQGDHEFAAFSGKFYFMYYLLSPFTGLARRIMNAARRL